jgi:hypothetical protein
VLNDRGSAKSTETTANDLLLHFMARPLWVENYGEFGVTSQYFIEVQPLFTRNSFQKLLATDTSGKFTSAHMQNSGLKPGIWPRPKSAISRLPDFADGGSIAALPVSGL